MPSTAPYNLVPSTPAEADCSGGLTPLDYDDAHMRDPRSHNVRTFNGRVSEAFALRVFFFSCALALALSAINLSVLSAHTAASQSRGTRTKLADLKRPSVYLGLENVVFNPPYCRSRGTFPKTFYTYDSREGAGAGLSHVHAPDDKMTLVFGGPIRAVVDVYIPDYGLENCTLNLRHIATPNEEGAHMKAIEVHLLPSADPADRGQGMFLDTLPFLPGRDAVSEPFHCPSRSHVFLEWRCAADDCENQIVIPLEGVTSLTASAESLGLTGFRVTQYESLNCISL